MPTKPNALLAVRETIKRIEEMTSESAMRSLGVNINRQDTTLKETEVATEVLTRLDRRDAVVKALKKLEAKIADLNPADVMHDDIPELANLREDLRVMEENAKVYLLATHMHQKGNEEVKNLQQSVRIIQGYTAPTMVLTSASIAKLNVSNSNNNNANNLRTLSSSSASSSSSQQSNVSVSGDALENFRSDKRNEEVKKQSSNVIKVTKHLISVIAENYDADGVFRESAEHQKGVTESLGAYEKEKKDKKLFGKKDATRLITDKNQGDFSIMSKQVNEGSKKVPMTPRDAGTLLKGVFKGNETDVITLPDIDPLTENTDKPESVKANIKLINASVMSQAMKLYQLSGVEAVANPNERGKVFEQNKAKVLASSEHINALNQIVARLPASHLQIFKMLINMMKEMASHSDKNNMKPYNVGVVSWGIMSGLIGVGTTSTDMMKAVQENNALGMLCAAWTADADAVNKILDQAIDARHAKGDYSDNEFPSKEYLNHTELAARSRANSDAGLVTAPEGLPAFVPPVQLPKPSATRNPAPPTPGSKSPTASTGVTKLFSTSTAPRSRSNSATVDSTELLTAAREYLVETQGMIKSNPFIVAQLTKQMNIDNHDKSKILEKIGQIITHIENNQLTSDDKKFMNELKWINGSGAAHDNYFNPTPKARLE